MNEILVFDPERDRRAEGFAMTDAGEDLDGVGLDLHPSAAAVALLAPPKLVVDRGDVDIETGGNALDDGDEGFAVRFAGCCEA